MFTCVSFRKPFGPLYFLAFVSLVSYHRMKNTTEQSSVFWQRQSGNVRRLLIINTISVACFLVVVRFFFLLLSLLWLKGSWANMQTYVMEYFVFLVESTLPSPLEIQQTKKKKKNIDKWHSAGTRCLPCLLACFGSLLCKQRTQSMSEQHIQLFVIIDWDKKQKNIIDEHNGHFRNLFVVVVVELWTWQWPIHFRMDADFLLLLNAW